MSRYEQFKKEFQDYPELLKVLEEAKGNKVIDEKLKLSNPLNCSFINNSIQYIPEQNITKEN